MEDMLQVATKQRIYDIGIIAADLQLDEEKVSIAAGMDYHEYLSQKNRLIVEALEEWIIAGIKKVMIDDMCVEEKDVEQRLATFDIKKRLESSYLNPLPTDMYVLAAEVVISTASAAELIKCPDIEEMYYDCRDEEENEDDLCHFNPEEDISFDEQQDAI